MKQSVMDEVKQIFRPEFLNRIDEIIVFHALEKTHMKKIVTLMCRDFTKRIEDQTDIPDFTGVGKSAYCGKRNGCKIWRKTSSPRSADRIGRQTCGSDPERRSEAGRLH